MNTVHMGFRMKGHWAIEYLLRWCVQNSAAPQTWTRCKFRNVTALLKTYRYTRPLKSTRSAAATESIRADLKKAIASSRVFTHKVRLTYLFVPMWRLSDGPSSRSRPDREIILSTSGDHAEYMELHWLINTNFAHFESRAGYVCLTELGNAKDTLEAGKRRSKVDFAAAEPLDAD